ncbi:MAG: aromatic ring-hydroxylating dioxygenase subunit alpha [Thermosynechococcaceae cyanobacterium]
MNRTILNPERLEAIQKRIVETAERPLEDAIALPAAAYTDPDFYQWEVEHVFKKQWLCVGHISQIPNVGDYLNLDLLDERLVITRDRENRINVLSRVCMHRGMDMMPSAFGHPSQGNRRSFVCPYHHWTYALDGSLMGALEMHKNTGFDPQKCRLPAFRSEVWEGFIFLTFDPDLESVQTHYSGLLPFVGHRQMADMEMVANVQWDCQFNWKILVENFMEPYHHMGAHHKTFEPLMPAAGTWTESETSNAIACHLPLAKRIVDNDEEYQKLIEFYLSPALKPEDHQEYAVYLGEPNFLLFVGPDRVYWYLLQPDGPNHMTLSTTLLVAPESKQAENYEQRLREATESLQRFHLEDMEVCTSVQAGLQTSRYQSGPLSHLEMPIWLFQQYLAQQIRGQC